MRRKMLFAGLGVLALTLILVSCPGEPPPGESSKTKSVQITNIPQLAKDGVAVSYKLYVQISQGMDASAGHVAEGEGLINGQSSLTLDLFEPKDPESPDADRVPWSGTGSGYNIAVTVSPENVENYNAILVHASMNPLSNEVQSYNWNTMIDLWTAFEGAMVEQIKLLYNGVIVPDEDIKGAKQPAE